MDIVDDTETRDPAAPTTLDLDARHLQVDVPQRLTNAFSRTSIIAVPQSRFVHRQNGLYASFEFRDVRWLDRDLCSAYPETDECQAVVDVPALNRLLARVQFEESLSGCRGYNLKDGPARSLVFTKDDKIIRIPDQSRSRHSLNGPVERRQVKVRE